MRNKIPDRWLEYTPMGSKVAGTRFIAFKAPLSKEICGRMKPSDRFTPEILMERCPNMRLLIDLTNTDRYYNKQEFIDRGVHYEKIMCPGQVIPPQSLIFRFFEIIDDFYLKNGLKDVLIGIHCTHGVNRTGYFIGRYMVQRMGFHYEKAIPCIEEARGHKIERTNYIKDLMIQVPIPSSLSSSSGKKVIDTKLDFKRGPPSASGVRVGGKMSDKSAEKQFRKQLQNREPPGKPSHRRTPEANFRSKEPPPSFRPKDPPVRSGNFGHPSGRPCSPGPKRPNSPFRRGQSPGRRGPSPGRRPPSPGRRGGKGSPPKRLRSPPRHFSPFSKRRSPPRRSPSRRVSSPRREDFGPQARIGDERGYPKEPVPHRSYSPRRNDPPSSNFPFRGPPDNQRNYGHSSNPPWQPYENRGFDQSNDRPSNYGSSSNQYSDGRPPERPIWDIRPPNQQSFNNLRSHGSSESSQWNNPPGNSFSTLPSKVNSPSSNFDSRSGGLSNSLPSGRYNDRRPDELKFRHDEPKFRHDEPKFSPNLRDEQRRPWNTNTGHAFNTGRFEENKGFPYRGTDYRTRPEEKFDKPYRSPPQGEYARERRPPSPSRDFSRPYDSGLNRSQPPPWENRRRSPESSFVGIRRRSKSPGRRMSPPPPPPPQQRRSRSPRRRSPPKNIGFDIRRSPPKNRPIIEGQMNRTNDIPPSNSHHFNRTLGSGPETSFQEKRFYDSRDDCRDLLNQKRHFEGDRGEMYREPKNPKLDLRGIPKEVDLRKVIRGSNPEPPLRDRLGPPPREERPADAGRRFGRDRSKSPRGRSPPKYGPPRRF